MLEVWSGLIFPAFPAVYGAAVFAGRPAVAVAPGNGPPCLEGHADLQAHLVVDLFQEPARRNGNADPRARGEIPGIDAHVRAEHPSAVLLVVPEDPVRFRARVEA